MVGHQKEASFPRIVHPGNFVPFRSIDEVSFRRGWRHVTQFSETTGDRRAVVPAGRDSSARASAQPRYQEHECQDH
ncbi:hypothetical protein D3C78_1699070 [compost metagenome]